MKKILIILVALTTIVSCEKSSTSATLDNSKWDLTHDMGPEDEGIPSDYGSIRGGYHEDIIFGNNGEGFSWLTFTTSGEGQFKKEYKWMIENDHFFYSEDGIEWIDRGVYEYIDADHIMIDYFYYTRI